MSYSRFDFADDVINCLIDIGALDATNIPDNDPRTEASLAFAAINALQRGPLAARFANETLNAVESLSAVAEQHGVHALADLFYLQVAILDGTHVQLDAPTVSIWDLIQTLPSAHEWNRHIKFAERARTPLSSVRIPELQHLPSGMCPVSQLSRE